MEEARSTSKNLPNDIDEIMEIVKRINVILPDQPKVLCHQDLFADNFLYDKKDLYLVDWEYAEWSDPFYDLASLCVEQRYEDDDKEMVLYHYFDKYSDEHIIHLEMMCSLYSMRALLWASNQDNASSNLKWLVDLHYQNFFSSVHRLRKYGILL